MIEQFEEYEVSAFLICESWLKSSGNFYRFKDELTNSRGLEVFAANRPGTRRGGGVCLVIDPKKLKLTQNKLIKKQYEIVSAAGKIIGLNRSIVIYCIYLPPSLTNTQAEEACRLVSDDISKLKVKLGDPYVVIGGDINQFGMIKCIDEHPEFTIITPLPTRNGACLDQIATNMTDHIVENALVSPLTSSTCRSDHSGVFNKYMLPNRHHFKISKYQTRKYTKKGTEAFIEEFNSISWDCMQEMNGAEEMNEFFQTRVEEMMDRYFPVKTYTVKNTDDPWITAWIKKKMKRKMTEYKLNGKSELYNALCKEIVSDLKVLL